VHARGVTLAERAQRVFLVCRRRITAQSGTPDGAELSVELAAA